MQIHSAYFGPYDTIPLMRDVLRGIDRSVLECSDARKERWINKQ